ncbi:MAG: AMIN domain-containing protein [Rhodanobacteraceae bacterium]|nr:MAG: AMIN domain-containing protein [Rhodanobacteraceae bacterium]
MRGTTRPLLLVFAFFCGAVACAAGVQAASAKASSTVKAVRIWGGPDSTRVIFELTAPVDYSLFQLSKPDRVVIDLDNGVFGKGVGAKPGKGAVRDMRIGRFQGKARIVLDLDKNAHPKSFLLNPTAQYGYRLVVDLGTPDNQPSQIVKTIDSDIAHGKPRPVVIAVDAGHGGDDSGATGPGGLKEKTVTLAIAKDLARLIDAQPGMHAVLTRTGDYYVPLEKRFEIAREHKADLFVSIHANSCPDYCDARGGSVWVLDTHGKQSEAARWLAKSENASDLIGGVSLDNKSHTLASVLLDLSQGASMHAAHEVGGDVLAALGGIEPLYRNTVQGANFVVLRSPDVPSILVETTFISNPQGERRLNSARDREQLAQAIFDGVKQYFETTPPPGTWFAVQRNKRLYQVASADEKGTAGDRVAPAGSARSQAPVIVAAARKKPSIIADTYQDMHKVTRGETLSGIARQYGVSMSALRSVNASKIEAGGGIQVGQVLMIPSS